MVWWETSASGDLDLHAFVVLVVLDGEDDHRWLHVSVRALKVEKGPGMEEYGVGTVEWITADVLKGCDGSVIEGAVRKLLDVKCIVIFLTGPCM